MMTEKNDEKKEKVPTSTHYVDILYKDEGDNLKRVRVPFVENEYNESDDYRENVENMALIIAEEGAFWADDKTIVPYHRVVQIRCVLEDATRKGPPAKKKGRDQRGKSKPKRTTTTTTTQEPE